MDTLARLQQRWEQLLAELKSLGPMRSGSICPLTIRSTDKSGALKAHGPYLIHTYKHHGKTITRRLRDPQQIETCRRQIANFRRFEQLTAELARLGRQLAEREEMEPRDQKKTSKR